MNKFMQKGQILLITLLILTVAMTIALALAGRTTTDINITRQVDESLRAFSAAEAGIEKSLLQGTAALAGNLGTADYKVTTGDLGITSSYDFSGTSFDKGEVATLWLVEHDDTGNIDMASPWAGNTFSVCWEDKQTDPALEISVYYFDNPAYKVKRFAFDINASSNANNFNPPANTNSDCGSGFFEAVVDISSLAGSIPLYARIKPYYESTKITVMSSTNFVKQGNQFESCGVIQGSQVTRCIQAVQPFKTPLDIFDNALYAKDGSI